MRGSAAGVRYGTFEIGAGDLYVIPAGLPHEFLNHEEDCLSVAWWLGSAVQP